MSISAIDHEAIKRVIKALRHGGRMKQLDKIEAAALLEERLLKSLRDRAKMKAWRESKGRA